MKYAFLFISLFIISCDPCAKNRRVYHVTIDDYLQKSGVIATPITIDDYNGVVGSDKFKVDQVYDTSYEISRFTGNCRYYIADIPRTSGLYTNYYRGSNECGDIHYTFVGFEEHTLDIGKQFKIDSSDPNIHYIYYHNSWWRWDVTVLRIDWYNTDHVACSPTIGSSADLFRDIVSDNMSLF